MKSVEADVRFLATFNAARPADCAQAYRAITRLMRQESRQKQATVFAFVQGQRSNLGVHAPQWAYQITGEILKHHPRKDFRSGRECGAYVLDVLRSRLIVALRLASKGQRRA